MNDKTIRESIESPEQIVKALHAAYQVLGMIADPIGSGATRLAFFEVRRALEILDPIHLKRRSHERQLEASFHTDEV